MLLYNNKRISLKENIGNYDINWEDMSYEKVHTKFLKIVLGTSKYTSNIAVLSDLGRFPISIKAMGLGINYWHNISCGNSPNELLSKAFIHESIHFEKSAWLQNIKYYLFENGLGDVWNNPISTTNSHIYIYISSNKRMEDQFIQGWFNKATTSISLHTLNMLKADYSYSTYFSVIKYPNMRRFFFFKAEVKLWYIKRVKRE